MPEEACAMVCGLFSAIVAILSWHAMAKGEWGCMIVALIFSVIDALLIGYVLAMKYCR